MEWLNLFREAFNQLIGQGLHQSFLTDSFEPCNFFLGVWGDQFKDLLVKKKYINSITYEDGNLKYIILASITRNYIKIFEKIRCDLCTNFGLWSVWFVFE